MPVGGNDDTFAHASDGAPALAAAIEESLVAGRYRVVRWLGAGGMGRVYEALDTELDERVALKVLHSGLTDEALERFRREVKLTRRIQHRNVARMFDIGEHRRDKFLTMELIEGAALTRELGRQMPWPRLRALAIQLCAGLTAAHEAGVVHRDLKPDNVMIERGTDRVVITDFGIARSGRDAAVTQLGELVGTPRYMAPEQLAAAEIDHRADVFSLGVMLYELATGERPWSGDSAVAIAVAQATQPPRPFTALHVPPEFAALVSRCIAIDVEQRPFSAALVGEAIASCDPGAAADEVVSGSAHTPRATIAPTPGRVRTERTAVAVLPVSCAPGDEYLADGLLDDLVDTLCSTGTLRVRPAGVVRSRAEHDPRELGRALEVDHIVAASLRRTPTGLRVSTRLIGVADGFQIWAQRHDCSDAEILATAEHIGRAVATALSAHAVGAERPTDPRAVDLYLRARAELRRFWGDHAQNAVDLLEQAATFAPTSPPILGALALATVQAWIMRARPELGEHARAAVERGLATGHGEAFLASCTFRLSRGDLEGAAQALGVALVRAPMSGPAHETAGRLLIELGAVAEGRQHLETAVALEPGRASMISGDLGRLEALEGDWDAAEARCRQLLADPDPSVAQLGSMLDARLASWRGDPARTLAAATRFAQRSEMAAQVLAVFGHATTARHLDDTGWNQLMQLFTRRDRPQRMQVIGLQLMTELSIVLGYPDHGLRALGKADDMGLIDIRWLARCPLLQAIAGDPRWSAIHDHVSRRAAAVLAALQSAAG